MNEHDRYHKNTVTKGMQFEATASSIGWTEAYHPRLLKLLELQDQLCHDGRRREDTILYNNGVYNGLKLAIRLADLILKERRISEKYCEKNGIHI